MGNKYVLSALAATVLGLAVGTSRADIIINIDQDGSNVMVTGSGSVDLTGLTFSSNQFDGSAGTNPDLAEVVAGPVLETGGIDIYTGLTGPASFGTGGGTILSSGTGDNFGVTGADGLLSVPTGYVSFTSLSDTGVFDNATLSSLGMTTGTYTYTWGTGGLDHTLTVQIGPAGSVTAVPEPSTAIVAVFGAVAFLGYGWSSYRRPPGTGTKS
jgi:hypothetical protein